VIIGVFFYLAQHSTTTGGTTGTPTPANSSVLHAVTNVSQDVSASVGTGGQQNIMVPTKGSPPLLTGPNGKPEVFYAGGEYCPFCAAERWAMVVALSRFGTFSHLGQIQSSEDNISTFTFYQSTYTSQYIDFVPVELAGNDKGQTLQTPTSDQQKLIDTYDGPPYFSDRGAIPFIDIANQRVSQGANYSPQTLMGLSWQDIANKLSDPSSDVTKGIVGSANYLTAAICMATKQQPGSVCTAAPIPQIEQTLGKAAFNTSAGQVGFVSSRFDIIMRRSGKQAHTKSQVRS
jgi:hypothetical protein